MKSAAKGIVALAIGIAFGTQSAPVFGAPVLFASAQDAQPAKTNSRLVGTVTAIQGKSVTVKTDAGVESILLVGDQTKIVRMVPGQKDISSLPALAFDEIQIGDRLLSRTTPAEDGKSLLATSIITMKKADIAQKQQQDQEAWQRNGIAGLVKAVDPAAQTITIAAGPTGSMTIHATSTTILRRYAPDSIKFDNAKNAPLAAIKVGDQLRARGKKNEDGSEFAADEIVSGTFRNIAATVVAIDATNSTITLNDLLTKKPISIHVSSESQLHKLPTEMAQMLAMRLKASAKGGAASAGEKPTGMENGAGPRRGGGDPQQFLARTPTITLSDLKKGDALMVVSTEGSSTTPATAVILVAGVEAMFQASTSASQNMMSAWNLSGGNGGADIQ